MLFRMIKISITMIQKITFGTEWYLWGLKVLENLKGPQSANGPKRPLGSQITNTVVTR